MSKQRLTFVEIEPEWVTFDSTAADEVREHQIVIDANAFTLNLKAVHDEVYGSEPQETNE